jgi:hypothetical protein
MRTQCSDNLFVCLGKSKLVNFIECHPANFIAFDRLRFPADVTAVVHVESHCKFSVVVVNCNQAIAHFYYNPQLLHNFPLYASFDGFPRLDFTAGKLPKTAMQSVLSALVNQNLLSVVPDRSNADNFVGHRRKRHSNW